MSCVFCSAYSFPCLWRTIQLALDFNNLPLLALPLTLGDKRLLFQQGTLLPATGLRVAPEVHCSISSAIAVCFLTPRSSNWDFPN